MLARIGNAFRFSFDANRSPEIEALIALRPKGAMPVHTLERKTNAAVPEHLGATFLSMARGDTSSFKLRFSYPSDSPHMSSPQRSARDYHSDIACVQQRFFVAGLLPGVSLLFGASSALQKGEVGLENDGVRVDCLRMMACEKSVGISGYPVNILNNGPFKNSVLEPKAEAEAGASTLPTSSEGEVHWAHAI